ncbi:MAG: rRNA processing protein RimM, partial [Bacteroidota bacterium]|nr:rRNA processing protein RimM [Bacteroidota bacterium]
MAYISHMLLGRITKVHGCEGAVTVRLEKTFTEETIPVLESVFLEIDGKPVPFFISESEYQGADILRLKFEDYDSPEMVSGFTGCRLFMTTGENIPDKSSSQNQLSGYQIHLIDDTLLGTIKEVIENPEQSLINIESMDGKEILIPLHKDLIINVDNKRKIIKMDLPEGLTEI